ncbi:hypothetical protein [Spiroplasma tabanidicola]|nr:hypothetical protein [Spiroplasma tabanidicola]
MLFRAEEIKKTTDEFRSTDIIPRFWLLKYNIKQKSTIYVWKSL